MTPLGRDAHKSESSSLIEGRELRPVESACGHGVNLLVAAEGLEKLRVDPTGKVRFRTITGQIVERTVGQVFVEFDDEVAHNCCLC